MFLFILLILQIPFIHSDENESRILTSRFKENLRMDPFLQENQDFPTSKFYIDKKIEHYVENVILPAHKHLRNKRSLSGIQSVVEMKTFGRIPAVDPKEIVIFYQNQDLHAVVLEEQGEILSIKKSMDGGFVPIKQRKIRKASKVAVFSRNTTTFIVTATNSTTVEDLEYRSNVFIFHKTGDLETIQTIDTSNATDIVIWEDQHGLCLGVSSLTMDVLIYKWQGQHFDVIQNITSYGTTRISPFRIQSVAYLALANTKSDDGSNRVYSHILRYDVEAESYKIYQRLLTVECENIEYFQMTAERNRKDHYLIVGNGYLHDNSRINIYTARSIVYKYIEDYFIPFQSIPLNGVRQWLPIEFENSNGILLAATFDGIRSFQYNGWRFIDRKIRFLDVVSSDVSRTVTAMRSYKVENKTILVMANEGNNDLMENMFTINLTTSNAMDEKYQGLLTWCLRNTENLKSLNTRVSGKPRRGDDQVLAIEDQVNPAFVTKLMSTLNAHESHLSKISDKMTLLLQRNNNHTIENSIAVSYIRLHNTGIMKNLQIDKINNISVNDYLNNILDSNNGFQINSSIQLTHMRLEEHVDPEIMNILENIQKLDDNIDVKELTINGVLRCKKMAVDGRITDLLIDRSHLLQTNEHQVLDTLSIENIEANEATATHINRVHLFANQTRQAGGRAAHNFLNKLEHFKIKQLEVSGYVNDLDIDILSEYALRQTGDQVIIGPYFWEKLEFVNLHVPKLTGRKLDGDMILLSSGNWVINNDIKFTQDLNVRNLTALNKLNDLSVTDGQLDLLVSASKYLQFVTGFKSFKNLELLNPINLQGKIRGKPFDVMNPAVQIVSNLELTREAKNITGNVMVEEIIVTRNIVGMEKNVETNGSLLRIINHGNKIIDGVFPNHLNFANLINVMELSTKKINNMNPHNWVVNGAKEPQKIRGEKHFPRDLAITGESVVSNMNELDIEELQTNVLKRDGDQMISGIHHIKYITTEKKIITNNSTFGDKIWTDVVTTTGKQELLGPAIIASDLKASSLQISKLNTRGSINNVDFAKLLNDAYTYDSDRKLNGIKIFEKLEIEDLNIRALAEHLSSLANSHLKVEDLDIEQDLSVKNLQFNDTFNGIHRDTILTIRNDDKTNIEVGKNYETITVYRQVFLKSNNINGIDLHDFENNTVKIDEEFEFDTVNLDKLITRVGLKLDGLIENMDLENLFQNTESWQTFASKKIFQGTMAVLARVNITTRLNKVDLSHLCMYGSDVRRPRILEGNVHFAKGPDVFTLNGANLRLFNEKAWFKDIPATIHGNTAFGGNTKLENDISVQGIVNHHDIGFLSKSYMSKTRDQIVVAHAHCIDKILFAQDVASPELNINGTMNGIDIKVLPKIILLNNAQVLEEMLYVENCRAMSTSGDYMINTLNLDREVMRYDRPNLITGPKYFHNIDIGILRTIERKVVIQNVDINQWLANGILRIGNFRISGNKSFKNVTFEKGIGLKGTFNGQKFSKKSILSKTELQIISGQKLLSPASKGVKFKVLKVKGTLNDIHIDELVHKQAKMSNDNTFTSPIVFRSNITTKNLNFRSLYQGINITEFIKNVTRLGSLNDLSQYYEDLLDMSSSIAKSLDDEACFLNYFKRVYFVPKQATLFPFCEGNNTSILSLKNENGSFIMDILDWNAKLNLFETKQGYSINLGPVPDFASKVSHANKNYIYLEYTRPNAEDESKDGKLIHIENATNLDIRHFETQGSTQITSFYIEVAKYNCLLFIDRHAIRIMCADYKDEFHFHQSIPLKNVFKVTTLDIDNDLRLIVLSAVSSKEHQITTWKLNNCSLYFEEDQTIEVVNAVSMDTISFLNHHFLAVAHSHLELDYGKIEILRFDRSVGKFNLKQRILEMEPTKLSFANLPTQELILYVLSASKRFNVYIYAGISGFKKKTVNELQIEISEINHFNSGNKHFAIVKQNGQDEILQGTFKGNYMED